MDADEEGDCAYRGVINARIIITVFRISLAYYLIYIMCEVGLFKFNLIAQLKRRFNFTLRGLFHG